MATIESLTEEYHQYLEEKKALAAIGAASAIAIGGAHFMNKDASAAEKSNVMYSDQEPTWGPGDWAYKGDQEDTPSDHPEEEPEAEEPKAATSHKFTRTDLDELSMVVWGEARGEGAQGMAAVAHVIVNRAEHDRWADSIKGVARADQQFSCWNSNDPNSKKMPKMLEYYNYLSAKPQGWEQWYEAFKKSEEYPGFLVYLEARKIARGVLQGKIKDPTNNAVFYHTGAVSPDWAVGQPIVARVGAHQFYRTDRKA